MSIRLHNAENGWTLAATCARGMRLEANTTHEYKAVCRFISPSHFYHLKHLTFPTATQQYTMSDQNHPYGNPPPMGDARYAGAMGVASAPVQDPSMLNYRGASLQQSFRLRERIKISREKPMNGLWIAAFPHMNMARVCGQAGYDFVILDWEHTPMGKPSPCIQDMLC